MPYLNLPKTPVPSLTQRVPLDGTYYLVSLEWNMRSGWYLGLKDAAGVVIFAPKRLRSRVDLLRAVTDERRPPGKLALVDVSGLDSEPTYDGMGSTYKIAYLSLAEIEALRALAG